MYYFDKMTPEERKKAVALRRARKYPWHSPPHIATEEGLFHITATCYRHAPCIGYSMNRIADFESRLSAVAENASCKVFAWCVLPNHYHMLVFVPVLKQLTDDLGKLHGATSYEWNGEESTRGRTVWYRCKDRGIRSEGHFWATMNYVHHNAVKHGYAKKWQDWPFSSAEQYLKEIGEAEAARIWQEYPVKDYGKGWDD